MRRAYVMASGIAIAGLLLGLWALRRDAGGGGGAPLLVYCAAVASAPMESIARAYEREHGVRVELQYGGSGTLLSGIEVARRGDLYLPADETYIELAREKGLVESSSRVARLELAVGVAAGNPKGIGSVEDLWREDVRVSFANPDAASVGRTAREYFTARGAWADLEAAITACGVMKPTVNDVAADVKIGAADAGIIWDVLALQMEGIELVPLPGAEAYAQHVALAVLTPSTQPEAAKAFAAYVVSAEGGGAVFEAMGYTLAEGMR